MADLNAFVAALPNPVLVVGQGQRIVAVNAPARALIGQDCAGWHYVTALRQPAILDAVEQALGTGAPQTARYSGNDGARETNWAVSVQVIENGPARSAVLSFQDVTAMEDAGEMRRDFVANVSHEMRTPLTSLLGFIETLQGPARNDPEAQQRFLGIMAQEAGRMHHLVEDLLSLSRVEDQERVRPTGRVLLGTLIGEVLEALGPVAEADGVQLITNLPDAPVEISGDWGQLWQVLSNLVENAIKYGRKGGTVTLGLSAPGHEPAIMQRGVRLSVRDEGDGIAAHHIARLTERFYRVDTHRSREIGGTGLGLAIVKHIITRHRGRLRINSEIGQGSVFTVVLPVGGPVR